MECNGIETEGYKKLKWATQGEFGYHLIIDIV